MVDRYDPASSVDAWTRACADGQPAERMVQAFAHTFDALWHRAHRTLGEVTLLAIADRVLYDVAEAYPTLPQPIINPSGLDCQALRERAPALPRADLDAAIRLLLVEFLGVLGNLTGGILSPALHATLAEVARRQCSSDNGFEPTGPERHDEDGAGK